MDAQVLAAGGRQARAAVPVPRGLRSSGREHRAGQHSALYTSIANLATPVDSVAHFSLGKEVEMAAVRVGANWGDRTGTQTQT